MGAIGTCLTLLDLAKRLDPNDKVAKIVELLAESNEILEDMLWKEGNLTTGEKTTVRTGLPTATWRKLNYGVVPTKSLTKQITDSCGMLEAYSEVDKKLAELNGNKSDFLLSEAMAHLEAMNQQLAAALFYGDSSEDPEKIMGLTPRFNVKTAATFANMLNGAGSGSTNTSVWLVNWGPNMAYGIYPKGSKAGIDQQDLGEQTKTDADGGLFQVLRSHFQWDCGLTVRDWRHQVRICNIDVATLTKAAATGADLIDLMTQALELPPSLMGGKPVFYCNRTIKSFLRRQIMNKSNVQLTMEQVGGKPVMMFGGVPVRRVDQILSTEDAVSFA